jgi:hypothetical protein
MNGQKNIGIFKGEKKMKIYAKQVPPEFQDSHFEPENWPGIIFHGNRWYNSHTTPEFDAIYNRFDGEKRILRALHLLTGKRYEKRTIRGSCQGDWQEIYYPVAEYTRESLNVLEIEYFDTGSEWAVNVDGCDVYIYTYEWNSEKIKEELAAAVGVKPENMILYSFSGWKRTPEYTEV